MNLLFKMVHGCGRGLRNSVAAIAALAFVGVVTAHAVNAQSNGRKDAFSRFNGSFPNLGIDFLFPAPFEKIESDAQQVPRSLSAD